MSDKSPKSKQRHDKQKKVKADSAADEKRRILDLKANTGGLLDKKKTP